MKFLVDAQLPPRLVRALVAGGHDAVHTLDLPEGNRSTDRTVAEAADTDDRVLITKDGDFRHSHRLRASPRRLLIVTTGHIGNDELLPCPLPRTRPLVGGGGAGRACGPGCRP